MSTGRQWGPRERVQNEHELGIQAHSPPPQAQRPLGSFARSSTMPSKRLGSLFARGTLGSSSTTSIASTSGSSSVSDSRSSPAIISLSCAGLSEVEGTSASTGGFGIMGGRFRRSVITSVQPDDLPRSMNVTSLDLYTFRFTRS
ncbi:hypothetical protein B0H19DRAFT_1097553 [Mycena capillaripes]|nr:hypothetical protein B0H19DRAFT_1097553 [Mycena capillaripes]